MNSFNQKKKSELEQPQLRKQLWGGVFTESGWEQVGSEVPACSSVQERIHELAVVLTEARLIADVVEFTCQVKQIGGTQRRAEINGDVRPRPEAHRWACRSGRSCTAASCTAGLRQTCGTTSSLRTVCRDSLSVSLWWRGTGSKWRLSLQRWKTSARSPGSHYHIGPLLNLTGDVLAHPRIS